MASMFIKSLQDVVKGIRANKQNLSPYISGVISEIKSELKTSDDDTKAQAIEKLTYLQLEGYEMSWANFHIVEVMSMPWFGHRHVGYLAASQSFTKDTDVILLTTHLFRKAFSPSTSDPNVMYETGAAISCLANICNKDLAMALLKDIYGMLNSARPYTRKKAVLVLYKLFQSWPKALRLSFPRLREKLQDKDPSVRSAAVYVVCELARNNPKNYLSLAPEFFKILTTSSNNWILIKIVKLLGSLVPLEPRLAKKLRDPLHDIITTTPAKSLLYECINTLISGKLASKSVVSLCMEKLRTFIEDPDQNLKYLGLLGLHKLMKQHLRVVAEHKDVVLDCLEDEDSTIRRRAIDIITRMVSRKNMGGIVRRLLQHLKGAEGDYRNYVMGRIIQICSQENFAFISDFAWYVETLLELTVMVGTNQENALALKSQFIDILVRVKGVRKFTVKHLTALLRDKDTASSGALTTTALSEVLFAAAWAAGEYPDLVKEPVELLKTILDPSISRLNPNTQIVYLHAALKICAYVLRQLLSESDEDSNFTPKQTSAMSTSGSAAVGSSQVVDVIGLISDGPDEDQAKEEAKNDAEENDEDDINIEIKSKVEESKSPKSRCLESDGDWRAVSRDITQVLLSKLKNFTRSNDVEVQERAVCYHQFIQALFRGSDEQKADVAVENMDLLALKKSEAEATIQQFVDFFGATDEEKLGLVHPKSQKRVKVPAGLDLDSWINEPESDSDDDDLFEEKDYANEDWDDLEDFLDTSSKKKKKRSKKASKNEESRKEERKAARARREKDPFYLKDGDDDNRKRVDVDDIPIKDLDLDLDLGKKKKKKKRKYQRRDEDLPEKYEVAAGPTLDGDDSEDENKGGVALDIDITTPLQEDEVIPEVGAYGQRGPQPANAGKPTKVKKKKEKKKKKKKQKKKDKEDATANILDVENSPAVESVKPQTSPSPFDDDEYELEVPEGSFGKASKKEKRSKKGKKQNKKKKDRKKDKETPDKKTNAGPNLMNLLGNEMGDGVQEVKEAARNSIPQSLFTSTPQTFRKQLLYKDNVVCIYFTTRSEKHQPYTLFLDVYMVTLVDSLENVRFELENKYEETSEKPNPSQPICNAGRLKRGTPSMSSLQIEWKSYNGPRTIPGTVYYQIPGTQKMVRQGCNMNLGVASFLLPMKVSMGDVAKMITSGAVKHSATTKVTLRGISMADGLRAISGILNMQLVKTVQGAATYYGRTGRSPANHVTVYVKAKKDSKKKLTVDVKASEKFLPSAICKQLVKALAELPTIP